MIGQLWETRHLSHLLLLQTPLCTTHVAWYNLSKHQCWLLHHTTHTDTLHRPPRPGSDDCNTPLNSICCRQQFLLPRSGVRIGIPCNCNSSMLFSQNFFSWVVFSILQSGGDNSSLTMDTEKPRVENRVSNISQHRALGTSHVRCTKAGKQPDWQSRLLLLFSSFHDLD